MGERGKGKGERGLDLEGKRVSTRDMVVPSARERVKGKEQGEQGGEKERAER